MRNELGKYVRKTTQKKCDWKHSHIYSGRLDNITQNEIKKKNGIKKDYRQGTGYGRKAKEIQYILIDISEKENRPDGTEIISVIKKKTVSIN